MDERPRSLVLALRLLNALLVVGAITVLLLVWRQDDLIRAWAEGNPAARELLATRGLEALKHAPEGQVAPPHFVPVAITLYVVMAALLWILGVFVGNGFEWSRLGITLLLVFSGVAGVGAIRTDPPLLFVVLTSVCIGLGAMVLAFLWSPATTAYIHADPESVTA